MASGLRTSELSGVYKRSLYCRISIRLISLPCELVLVPKARLPSKTGSSFKLIFNLVCVRKGIRRKIVLQYSVVVEPVQPMFNVENLYLRHCGSCRCGETSLGRLINRLVLYCSHR